jgi:hypothetical protein
VKISIRFPFITDSQQQANNEDLVQGVNAIGQHIFSGSGVPSFTPPGPALFFRHDFGVNASVYVWDGSWKSVT